MVEEVGATALLYVLGAGLFNLVGPLAFVFDYLRACPLDPGWGGECLLSGSVTLMQDSVYCVVESFAAKFAGEIGFTRAVASEFMGGTKCTGRA